MKEKLHFTNESKKNTAFAGKELPQKKSPSFKVIDKRISAHQEASDNNTETEFRSVPTYVEKLEKLIDEKNEKLKQAAIRIKELQDEYESYKIRLRKESSKEIEAGRKAVLMEVLEILDNFDRAVQSARENQNFSSFLSGIELIRQQFLEMLSSFNVKKMDCEGAKMDPKMHDVVSVIPVEIPQKDGRIVGIISEGYLIGDSVLRPARVIVGKFDGKEDKKSEATEERNGQAGT